MPPSLIVLAYPVPMQFNVVSHKSSDLKYQTFLKHNIAPAEVIVKGRAALSCGILLCPLLRSVKGNFL